MSPTAGPQPLSSTSTHVAPQEVMPVAALHEKSSKDRWTALLFPFFMCSAIVCFTADTVAAPNRLLSVMPSSISFGSVNVEDSTSQSITLINTGNGAVTISGATVTGAAFSISGLSLPFTLSPRQSTCFSAVFTPTAGGTATGSLSVASNATYSPTTVSLSGFGQTLLLTPSPSNIRFGILEVGNSSTQTVVLTNTGNASVSISQANVTGGGFSISGLSAPLTLNAGQSATFKASFAPASAGYATGSISVVSSATNSPTTVLLSGTGTTRLITPSPTSTNFGKVILGESATLPVVLYNTGTDSVTLTQATTTGAGFSISDLSLPLTLSAGQNIGFSVTFAPTTAGSSTGNVTIVSDATNCPTNESLSGIGTHAVKLSWTASTSQVSGYNVYSGSVSGGPYSKANSYLVAETTYTDTTVQAGQTYYYVTTAVDSNNNESIYSNEVQASVPSP
jgi:Abnormal spindle-like microcephaly-assoc'd, ASPM-SPD-2-Hydin